MHHTKQPMVLSYATLLIFTDLIERDSSAGYISPWKKKAVIIITSYSIRFTNLMAKSLLALAVIVVATTQVAFATYYSKACDPPHRIDYGGYTPYSSQYSVGSKIKFHCDKGYKLYGASWTVCKWDKRAYWAHPLPICKRRFTTTVNCWSKLH